MVFQKKSGQKEQYDVIGEVWGDERLRQTIGNERLRKRQDSEPSEQAEAAHARPPPPHARPATRLLGLKILLGPENTSRSPRWS